MKLFFLIIPLLLSAVTREECAQWLEQFAPLEKAYDAVVASGIASPVSERIIRDFRRDGERIYNDCKNKMSTTPWYMLGKKVKSYDVDIAKFHMESFAEVRQYAISNPPVITKVVCGTVTPGTGPVRKTP